MPQPLQRRGGRPPDTLVLIRLGRYTLTESKLAENCEVTFNRWGLFGFSVFGLGRGGYAELARLVPLLGVREWVMEARSRALLDAGFPVLPTNESPHWTIVFATPEPAHFDRVRTHFSSAIKNPAWTGRR